MTFIKLGKSKDVELDDNEVVRLIVEENQKQLLETLYERYINRIYRKCLTLTRDSNLAKDLTHDIMVKILLNLAKFKGQFGHLRKEEQMILLMRYQDGMSIRDIANVLEIKEGAVKMRLKRSRAQLSKRLKVKKK